MIKCTSNFAYRFLRLTEFVDDHKETESVWRCSAVPTVWALLTARVNCALFCFFLNVKNFPFVGKVAVGEYLLRFGKDGAFVVVTR